MRTMMKTRRAGLLLALLILAACGGGGGGDSTPSGPTAVLDSPRQIQADVMQTGTMPSVRLSGRAVGDASSLAGKTLYVIVEDSASLFDTSPGAIGIWSAPNNGLTISLTGTVQATAGRKTGSMRVFVCLDSACRQPMNGSPLSVPYDVTVWPRLALASNKVRVETTFGAAPVVESVPVPLPAFLESWAVIGGYPGDWLGTIVPRTVSATQGRAEVSFRPVVPGTYSTMTYVRTFSRVPGGLEVGYMEPLEIEYVVNPSDTVGAVFSKPEVVQEHKLNDLERQRFGYGVITTPGAAARLRSIEYLSHPAAANGHSQVAAWLLHDYMQTWACPAYFDSSLPTGSGVDCLPVGNYDARAVYDVTYNGVTTAAYMPIRMTIVP